MSEERKRFVPVTPSGLPLSHLEASTFDDAWARLLEDAKHMPYKTRENFEKRGYRVMQHQEITIDSSFSPGELRMDNEDFDFLEHLVVLALVENREDLEELRAENANPQEIARTEQSLKNIEVLLAKVLFMHSIIAKRDEPEEANAPTTH